MRGFLCRAGRSSAGREILRGRLVCAATHHSPFSLHLFPPIDLTHSGAMGFEKKKGVRKGGSHAERTPPKRRCQAEPATSKRYTYCGCGCGRRRDHERTAGRCKRARSIIPPSSFLSFITPPTHLFPYIPPSSPFLPQTPSVQLPPLTSIFVCMSARHFRRQIVIRQILNLKNLNLKFKSIIMRQILRI